LFPLLTYLADKKPENVKKAFPQLFKLAEKLVEYGATNYHGSIPFKDLYKIKNSRATKCQIHGFEVFFVLSYSCILCLSYNFFVFMEWFMNKKLKVLLSLLFS